MSDPKKSEIVKMDLSSKSNKSKQEKKAKEDRHVEKVVKGETMIKKDTGLKKLYNTLFDENPKEAISHTFTDEVVPDLKSALTNAGKYALDRMINGDGAGKKRSGRDTDYNERYRSEERYEESNRHNSRSGDQRDERRSNTIDFRNISYDTREDAKEVIQGIYYQLDDYDDVAVGTVYELAGFENYIQQSHWNYGWIREDLDGVIKEYYDRGDWYIKFPRTRRL